MTEDPKLTEALQRFYEAFNNRDVPRLLTLFETCAVYITSSGSHAGGPEDIRAALQRAVDCETRIVQGTRKTIIAGDIALMMSNWSQASPTEITDTVCGTSNIVFRRQPDGEWLIVIDNPIGISLLDTLQIEPLQ